MFKLTNILNSVTYCMPIVLRFVTIAISFCSIFKHNILVHTINRHICSNLVFTTDVTVVIWKDRVVSLIIQPNKSRSSLQDGARVTGLFRGKNVSFESSNTTDLYIMDHFTGGKCLSLIVKHIPYLFRYKTGFSPL